jgi:hypothetical protein
MALWLLPRRNQGKPGGPVRRRRALPKMGIVGRAYGDRALPFKQKRSEIEYDNDVR